MPYRHFRSNDGHAVEMFAPSNPLSVPSARLQCIAEKSKCYEMSSFDEKQATTLLKERPLEFVKYNKHQLSRVYPAGTRFDSSNFMPQVTQSGGPLMLTRTISIIIIIIDLICATSCTRFHNRRTIAAVLECGLPVGRTQLPDDGSGHAAEPGHLRVQSPVRVLAEAGVYAARRSTSGPVCREHGEWLRVIQKNGAFIHPSIHHHHHNDKKKKLMKGRNATYLFPQNYFPFI